MEKKVITEEMDIQKTWYEMAKNQSPETINDFIKSLINDYQHDYGTICHAMSAAAIGAISAIDKSDEGGITGFQAGCIMWGFIQNWMTEYKDKPVRLVSYHDMLYPQYVQEFDTIISKETWDYLQSEAKKLLQDTESASERVKTHWKSIIDGNIPFDYKVKDEN